MKQTLESPAEHHIARLAASQDHRHHHHRSECAFSISMLEILVTTRHQQRGIPTFAGRCADAGSEGAQPCEVLMTTAPSHTFQQPRRCILVWFAKISILAPWLCRISVENCALTYKGAAALPPHTTPFWSADVILRHSRTKSLMNGSQTGASVTDTTPLFKLADPLGDLLALSDSAWRRDRVVSA